MDKQQIISFIQEQVAAGKISKGDLMGIASGSEVVASSPVPEQESSSRNLINVFYAIGAIIAVVGVGILIGQHWEEIGFAGRILVTLGISLLSYVAALLFYKPEQMTVSQVMFTVSAALAPLGSYVLLNEANISFDWGTQIFVSLALLFIFGAAFIISRKNILVVICVGLGTWAYYALIFKVFSPDYYGSFDILKWAAMLLGFSYLLISYGHHAVSRAVSTTDAKEKKAVENILYSLGTLAILSAGISIGGFFDLPYIILIFGAFYGSVYLKSRGMLILGALFLMAHIIKLTSKYFVDSIGWPVSLIVIGFLVIGVGYLTYYLNKKYI
jgi:uncharacterized membrane protein (UPF0136 family)